MSIRKTVVEPVLVALATYIAINVALIVTVAVFMSEYVDYPPVDDFSNDLNAVFSWTSQQWCIGVALLFGAFYALTNLMPLFFYAIGNGTKQAVGDSSLQPTSHA